MSTVNWSDPKAKISKYFTVKEALWLPTWSKLAVPSEEEKEAILKMAAIMDNVRDLVEAPIVIHVWLRPADYNKLIGGAPASMHIKGCAVDFHVEGSDCDNIRKFLLPHLKELGVRMEDMPKGPWVHLDNKPCDDKYRFFKP